MKPIWRGGNFETKMAPTECSIYHEAFIFNEYYRSDDIYNKSLLTIELDDDFDTYNDYNFKKITELFRTTLKRVLLEMHTFIPGQEDVESWMDKLYNLQQTFNKDLINRYAEAIVHPEPVKIEKYIVDVNFFDTNDQIIQMVKRIRNEEKVSPAKVSKVLDTEANSRYGQAIKKACRYISIANEYFENDLEIEDLKKGFEIGKMGRHGGIV